MADKRASKRLNLGINELFYIPFPFSKKQVWFCSDPLLHLASVLIIHQISSKIKNKSECSCFEAYCLNN